jgi:hypothetical protein
MLKIRTGISLIIILSSLISCDKNDEYDGRATFYTNAQALLNCGSFEVSVYVDGEEFGTLSQALAPKETDPVPNCGAPLTLTIKLKKGDYTYSAEGECAYEKFSWEGDFRIVKDSCTRIFLDLTE